MDENRHTTQASDNWGRWGAEDERGTLNLIDSDTVLAATRVCRSGTIYNLGLPVQRAGTPTLEYRGSPQRLTLVSQTDTEMYQAFNAPVGVGANEDVLVIPTHNGTHMDALSHVFADGVIYNGFTNDTFGSHTGAARCGVEKSAGFAGRAVLLDVAAHYGTDWLEPGYGITAEDLEACRVAQRIDLHQGDILLVHTGWLAYYDSVDDKEQVRKAQPGLGLGVVDFVRDNSLSAIGADNSAIEVIPFSAGRFLALHIELLQKLGVTFLEHLRIGQMAVDHCYESLLVVAPLLITGATGSPINPIAIG